jgi:hypothetical protein
MRSVIRLGMVSVVTRHPRDVGAGLTGFISQENLGPLNSSRGSIRLSVFPRLEQKSARFALSALTRVGVFPGLLKNLVGRREDVTSSLGLEPSAIV